MYVPVPNLLSSTLKLISLEFDILKLLTDQPTSKAIK